MLGFIWHTEHHIYFLPCIYIYWWSLCPAKWMYQCQKVAWSCVHMNKEDTSLQSQFLIHIRKDTCEFREGDCCLEYSIYHTAKVAPYTHACNRLLFVFTKSQRGNLLTACGMCTHTVDLRCLMSCSAKWHTITQSEITIGARNPTWISWPWASTACHQTISDFWYIHPPFTITTDVLILIVATSRCFVWVIPPG